MSRLTPPRPFTPLSDDAWQALLPYVLPRAPQGRRIPDLRHRMNALSTSPTPRATPGAPSRPSTATPRPSPASSAA
ncbi:hypothetical protein [Roseomonas sp. KE2513]|uniref:hypothetical protein n=1 Tax=Roseomonas sp. KE2513 TaxID=2479202 RepID=UPI0018DFC6DD|nr:hypothetical protein [Roseomonas sp. KE2513]